MGASVPRFAVAVIVSICGSVSAAAARMMVDIMVTGAIVGRGRGRIGSVVVRGRVRGTMGSGGSGG